MSLVSLPLYLFVAYATAELSGNYMLAEILSGSEATIWVVLIGLAAIGTIGVLLLDGVPWWKKLLATALIFLTQLVFLNFDSYRISGHVYSSYGIDIAPTAISIFMSIFTFGLPLIAWNLVRRRQPWTLVAAFGYGVISSPIAVSISQLINTVLDDSLWGYAASRIPWVLAPLLGLLLMHSLGDIGRATRTNTLQPPHALGKHNSTTEQTNGYAYPMNTTAPLPITNTLAILSLILSFVIALVGVILGHVALNQITRTGQQGRGLAIAGIAVGYISLIVGAIFSIRAFYLFSQLF